MTKEKYEIFKKDIIEHKIYLTYVRTKVKRAESYTEEELVKLHSCYYKLCASYGKFSGSEFKFGVTSIIESNLSYEEKYKKYKKYISDSILQYNKAYALHTHKHLFI